MDIRIYYEDTDCGGVVYYANYLKYFERARTDYLDRHGLSVAGLLKEGTQFMVVHAELDYRSPARYGDVLRIDTVLSRTGKASLTFAHVIRDKSTGRVVVEGAATLVTVDLQGRAKRLPPGLLESLQVAQAPSHDGKRARAAKGAPAGSRRHGG